MNDGREVHRTHFTRSPTRARKLGDWHTHWHRALRHASFLSLSGPGPELIHHTDATYLGKTQSSVSMLFVERAAPAPAAAPPPVLAASAKTGGRLTLQGSGDNWRAQNGSMVIGDLLSWSRQVRDTVQTVAEQLPQPSQDLKLFGGAAGSGWKDAYYAPFT